MIRVVLVNPQIPSQYRKYCPYMRGKLATELHLVAPLGFEISDRHLKRAGLDYWPYVDLNYHANWEAFKTNQEKLGGRLIGFSVSGKHPYTTCNFQVNDWLLFGSETQGLSAAILAKCHLTTVIPMTQPHVRSLNLSVSVAVGLFEARRQLGY